MNLRREEGMRLLNLPAGASEEEVKRAYRRLAREVHPDTGEEPDTERLQQLGEACEVALEHVTGQELVTRKDIALMLRTQGELVKVSQESEATLSRVVVHHVGKLAAARSRRLTISGLGTVVGLLLAAIGAVVRTLPSLQAVLIPFGALLAICSLVVGAMALLNKEREERLRIEVEEAAETLSDRAALVGTLAELGLDGFFTREDLQEAIYYWSEMDNEIEVIRFQDRVPLSRVAAKIGPVDFARLLLSRGLESGMIVEAEESDDHPEIQYGYRRS
jgi:hypothetical protein